MLEEHLLVYKKLGKDLFYYSIMFLIPVKAPIFIILFTINYIVLINLLDYRKDYSLHTPSSTKIVTCREDTHFY